MKKRIEYLDLVKVVAIFLVFFAHSYTLGTKLYYTSSSTMMNGIYLFLDCFRTINNALLFMVSGVLLLKGDALGDKEIKKYLLRISRYVVVILIFSIIQYGFKLCIGEMDNVGAVGFLKIIYHEPIHYTYWFIYTYLGYLLMLPFSQYIAKNMSKKAFIYLICITIFLYDICPILQNSFGIGNLNISVYLTKFNYALYPIIGFYLNEHMKEFIFDKNYKIYLLTLCSFAGVFFASVYTGKQMKLSGAYGEDFISLFNIVTAITVFCWCFKITEHMQGKVFLKKVVYYISNAVLGCYLLENIIEYITQRLIYSMVPHNYPKLTICCLYIIFTIICGTVFVNLIKKIPGVNRFI